MKERGWEAEGKRSGGRGRGRDGGGEEEEGGRGGRGHVTWLVFT